VRLLDRKFIKPALLREVQSKDEKLLNTFKKINEFNMAKMAENPEFVLNGKTKGGGGDEEPAKPKPRRLSLFPITRDKEPSPNSQYRDLLETAMYKPQRRVKKRFKCFILNFI
jgi:hypothetical protein